VIDETEPAAQWVPSAKDWATEELQAVDSNRVWPRLVRRSDVVEVFKNPQAAQLLGTEQVRSDLQIQVVNGFHLMKIWATERRLSHRSRTAAEADLIEAGDGCLPTQLAAPVKPCRQ
jgi:hypothetical protein